MQIQFKPVQEPEELDFYEIFDFNNVRHIHIHGYCFRSDSAERRTEDNPDGIYWGNVVCAGFIETLDGFISHLAANASHVNDTYSELAQYQSDLTPEEMTEEINTHFGGWPPEWRLPFTEITADTICGQYVA